MTQRQRVLRFVAKRKTITSLQAERHFGIMRLSSIIHQLRKKGWPISTQIIRVRNRFGDNCDVARYSNFKEA